MSSDPLLAGAGVLPGPPAEPLGGILLGIDVGGTKVAVGTADQSGRRLRVIRFPSNVEDGAHAMLDRVLTEARALALAGTRENGAPLVGVALVCPGIAHDDGVRLAPNNPGWDTVRVADTVRAAFPGVPIAIMNDVKAAALAEAAHGELAGIHCGLFVNLGTGLAAAIVMDGKVVTGANGAAGEIGYQLPGTATPVAFVDGHAPLEEAVSGKAIADRVSAVLGRPASVAEAFAIAEDDVVVRGVLDDALELLVTHLANLAVALDPQRVVLGGGVLRQADAILPRLEAAMRRVVPFPPEVRLSAVPDDAGLAGALELAARARVAGG